MPGARRQGALIAPMRSGGVELIVGVARDEQWGLTLAVGLGGVLVHVIDDTALRTLPVDEADVRQCSPSSAAVPCSTASAAPSQWTGTRWPRRSSASRSLAERLGDASSPSRSTRSGSSGSDDRGSRRVGHLGVAGDGAGRMSVQSTEVQVVAYPRDQVESGELRAGQGRARRTRSGTGARAQHLDLGRSRAPAAAARERRPTATSPPSRCMRRWTASSPSARSSTRGPPGSRSVTRSGTPRVGGSTPSSMPASRR